MSNFIYCCPECQYAERRYSECRQAERRYSECPIQMLSIIINATLSLINLAFFMPSVVMLNVVNVNVCGTFEQQTFLKKIVKKCNYHFIDQSLFPTTKGYHGCCRLLSP